MPMRLIAAYSLIVIILTFAVSSYLHLTKERRRAKRSYRAYLRYTKSKARGR